MSIQSQGGIARAEKLSPEERKSIAQRAAETRWAKPRKPKPAVLDGFQLTTTGHADGLYSLHVENIPFDHALELIEMALRMRKGVLEPLANP